ncbi:DUF3152 domain-containing protein [Streptomyces hainanensis]|uniref:DUF3152 domain-containing protein n=1 Tax=Streptomyces hainanensis TaxID=402648 RepID=A0A4V2Y3J3_9ACTN|nr:DUF3152 domain-containing protein [Streptomyces hainanensis]TDC76685.1 DUF3152 domain-containing protein [Streptomyces hainanensis]
MGSRALKSPQSRGRARRRRRPRRALRVVQGAALLLGLAVALVALRMVVRDDVRAESAGGPNEPTAPVEMEPSPLPTTEEETAPELEEPLPEEDGADDASGDEGDDEPADEERIPVPETGPGTFRAAPGGGAPVGGSDVLTYRLQIEDGIEIEPDAAAAEVGDILADPRGWTTGGDTGFQLVEEGPSDFVVQIATPGTVDAICGQYGLDTGGEVNCSVAQTVVVNLRRWVQGSPQFAGPVEEYRALIINHEVGHYLGYGHEGCPGPGEPAPAMMQQIKGLDGCVANAWPHDENGEYLSGPSVP